MKYHNIPTLFDNQASLVNGKQIGTESVHYIQDAGQKVAGTTYIDKNTNELYVCVTTTNSVNNDGNFSKFNLKEAFNKLDNLRNEYHLQAVVTPISTNEFASCCQLKSIMIPRTHKYIHCRWSYVTPTANSGNNYTAGTKTYEISQLSVGALLGSELYIKYEGADNEYYYFHSVFDSSWKDNSLLVYSK